MRAVLVALVAVVALAGCGGGGAKADPTATYMQAVKSAVPGGTTADYTNTGKVICQELKTQDAATVRLTVAASGANDTQQRAIVKDAAAAYCPDLSSKAAQ